jgi:TPR repeat protein
MMQYGICLQKGIGQEQNLQKSIQIILQTGTLSFVDCGLFLLNGIFCNKDEKQAVHFFEESSLQYKELGKFWVEFCFIGGFGI